MPPKKRVQTSPSRDAGKKAKQDCSQPEPREEPPSDSISIESEVVRVKEELSCQGDETASLSSPTSNPKFWCEECGKDAAEACLAQQHSVCSLRQMRLQQAAPKAQRLGEIASSALEVVKALQDAKAVLDAQLEQWRGRLRHVKDAQKELWAAADEGRDLEEPALEEGLEPLLQDASSLLAASCHLRMDVEVAGSTWNADLQVGARGSGQSLLGLLVLQLHQDRSLVKDFRPEECLDVSTYCRQEEHSQELVDVLQNHDLDKVRKLEWVVCHKWPNWCKMLLQRVAPRVQWLQVEMALREHLDVIQNMPALRYLYVHLDDSNTDAPDLPLQLEDLEVRNVQAQHLQAVQRMPNLRKLTLFWSNVTLDVAFPPLPPDHRGLQWLQVFFKPASTVLSLAKAHATTLLELRIQCASEGDSEWHFKDLAEGLRRCGLVALRRVVLLRRPAEHFPDNRLRHGAKSCRRQKRAVWDGLLAADPEKATRVVKVLCEECDEFPDFPDQGDFTWKED